MTTIITPFVIGPGLLSFVSAVGGAVIGFLIKAAPLYAAFIRNQEKMETAFESMAHLSEVVEKLTTQMVTLNTKFEYFEKAMNP